MSSFTPFHAMYVARSLFGHAHGAESLAMAYASSDVATYPYQVAAAQFAMRSPYLPGCALCDDGSLGKSIEALLLLTQAWCEGKDRLLILVPTPLLGQWLEIMEEHFTLPFCVVADNATWEEQLAHDNPNPFAQDGLVLTTYDFAAEKTAFLSQISWHMAVFEEAHHLRGPSAEALREAVGGAFKLLLTATPMQNSIMDLYNLITFIDETALGDADAFQRRYFRRPENYGELAATASRYCFRTLRSQVESYVQIPQRLPVTVNYSWSPQEEKLAEMVAAYLEKPAKQAFPQMDHYYLTMQLTRALSSSPYALANLARTALSRVREPELVEMEALATSIRPEDTEKGRALLRALQRTFAELKKRGANRKSLIFTQSLATLRFLRDLLSKKYKVLTFDGSNSTEYTIMKRFEKEADILIATDVAAEGFNLEFCSFVINYDLPYNVLTIEQRINRCHRQGQRSDVIALSFLNPNNFADVRILELINKRILQFGGVFGMADGVLGGFSEDVEQGLAAARTTAEIERAHQETLARFEEENKQIVAQTEQILFSTFSREIADRVTVMPQYIRDKTAEINDRLWALTKYFFRNNYRFVLNDETRTLSCIGVPPKVFTGAAMRRNEYSMAKGYQPASGRHTIAGSLARNIMREIFWRGIPDSGSIVVDAEIVPCMIGYYHVKVKVPGDFFGGWRYNAFVGKTRDGRLLSHDECAAIMALPVVSFTKEGDTYGERDGLSKPKEPHELDALIRPEEFLERAMAEDDSTEKEEIERLKAATAAEKAALNRQLGNLRTAIRTTEQALDKATSPLEKLEARKRLVALQKQVKVGEQDLFIERARLDAACEARIQELLDRTKYTVEVKRDFVIRVEGQ